MKRSEMKTVYGLALAALIVFLYWGYGYVRTAMSSLPGNALAGAVLLSSDADRAKIDELLSDLSALESEVGALREVAEIPTYVSLETEGAKNLVPFGQSDSFGSVDKTIVVRVSGTKPATYLGIKGLSEPFVFKNGSYPGTGGTCAKILSDGCTLVISYVPALKKGDKVNDYKLRNVTSVSLLFNGGSGSQKETDSYTFYAYANAPGIPTISFSRPSPAIVGQPVMLPIFLMRGVGDAGVPLSVKISSVPAPANHVFSLVSEDCTKATTGNCQIVFKALSNMPGDYTDQVNLSYDNGYETGILAIPLSISIRGSDFSKTPENNLLIVYNKLSDQSKTIKDYYLKNRPGFEAANVIGVDFSYADCQQGFCEERRQISSKADFDSKVRSPILAWLTAHPEKNITDIVMIRGIPSRIGPAMALPDTVSASTEIDHQLTFLDMGSLEATLAYVDKIKAMYEKMPKKSIFVSSKGTGQEGTTYYLEDAATRAFEGYANLIQKVLVDYDNPIIDYRPVKGKQFTSDPLKDVAGFFTWGANSGRDPMYALNGNIVFNGNSGWYAIQTAESFNGQAATYWQGTYEKWFAANAFGGTHYEHTPVAAVAHIDEPTVLGLHDRSYFVCWEAGQLLGDCGTWSKQSPQGTIIGDPWIRK